MTVATDDDLRARLAAPPRPPRDVDLFSSNTLFGEPGIYPQGTPMTPATGPPVTTDRAVAALVAVGLDGAAARLADPELVARVPDAGPRAGLLALSLTVAAPVLDAFLAGTSAVDTVGIGVTASPGRIVGPAADGGPGERLVNERYRAEEPTLLAGSLAHDLLWSGSAAGQYEEATLHALVAVVHLQLVARAPGLAPRVPSSPAGRTRSRSHC